MFAGSVTQTGDRGKDAACDDVALNPGKPQLHLIQPGRIGRGEAPMDLWMFGEEALYVLGLCTERLSRTMCTSLALARLSRPSKNAMNSWLVCRPQSSRDPAALDIQC